MALVKSRFTWGFEITAGTNDKLDFIDNGQAEDNATIPAGVYCPAELAAAIQTAMRTANSGNNNNTCTYSFTTRKFTFGGTSTFSLLWNTGANSTDCSGMVGFDSSADDTGSTSYTSDSAVDDTHSEAFTWSMALPHIESHTPITAAADGTKATGTIRDPRGFQHVTDGGKDENIHIVTIKSVTIDFNALSTSEQVNMELLLDWLEQGRRFNWQPDTTSNNALRLVWKRRVGLQAPTPWRLTASEVSYGTLEFLETLSRT